MKLFELNKLLKDNNIENTVDIYHNNMDIHICVSKDLDLVMSLDLNHNNKRSLDEWFNAHLNTKCKLLDSSSTLITKDYTVKELLEILKGKI